MPCAVRAAAFRFLVSGGVVTLWERRAPSPDGDAEWPRGSCYRQPELVDMKGSCWAVIGVPNGRIVSSGSASYSARRWLGGSP